MAQVYKVELEIVVKHGATTENELNEMFNSLFEEEFYEGSISVRIVECIKK